MARRTQTATDRSLADMVVARWRHADEQRSPRVTAWNESYRNHLPQWIGPEVTRPPKVKYPYLHRVTTTQTTIVMEATDGAPRWMLAQPMTPGTDQQRRAEAVTEYLENVYRKKSADINGNNRLTCKRVASMGLRYGNADFLVQWNERWGCPQWEALDPYDVWRDADHGRFYVVKRIVTLSELGSRAESIAAPAVQYVPHPDIPGMEIPVEAPPRDGGRAMKAFKAVERAVRAGEVQTNTYTEAWSDGNALDRRHDHDRVAGDAATDGTGYGPRPEDDPFNVLVTVLEYYETCDYGMIAKIIPGYGDDGPNLVFQAEENPYGCCPIVPFIPYRLDCEHYGLGNGEIVGKLAVALDWNLRGSLDAISVQGRPPLLHTRRSNLKKQYFENIYGMAFEVSDVQRDMAFMSPSIGPSFHQIGEQIVRQVMDFGTGEGAHDAVKVGQARNATAAAISESYANTADRVILSEWRETMEQLAHVTIAVARVHTTEPQVVPILGRRTQSFIEILPRYLEGSWTVTFGGTSQGAQQKVTGLFTVAQTYSATGELDMRETLRETLRLLGERDTDRFLTRKDEAPPMDPAREWEMLEAGQLPEVSPRENLLQHWQVHNAVHLPQAMQTWGPQDPRTQKLQWHIAATTMAWQAQMAQMGQGGSGSSSSSPAPMPMQGGQGQPMSPQMPAFMGLNQQRQQSNEKANGQAPGPMGGVPNRIVGAVSTGGPK